MIVAGVKGPIARAAYWVNMNVIDGVVNGVGRGTTAFGRVMYRYVRPGTGRRCRQRTRPGDGPGRWPAPTLQSGQVQRYALMLFASVGLIGLALTRELRLGEHTEMDWFQDWALTLAVFVPAVGHGARCS